MDRESLKKWLTEQISYLEHIKDNRDKFSWDPEYDLQLATFRMALERLEPVEPLTLEQLREMDGKPVWVEFEDSSGGLWGIVHISVFEQIVFPDGLHCTIGKPYYGKIYKAYAYPPAHIDREAWEPCEEYKERED